VPSLRDLQAKSPSLYWFLIMATTRPTKIVAAIILIAHSVAPRDAAAVLTFNVEANGWPNAAHRDAAVAAMTSALARYNNYGDFGNSNIYVYYNSGIPTAQASYCCTPGNPGSIGFGGTYPNERVTMHEIAHYLGSGTFGDPWDGARGEALIDQFDGLEATLEGDANHFWPYGLNFDSEGAEINRQRHVAVLYAQRADLGIGSTANPWTETSVNLTASDALGEAGFNYASKWSDGRFAHPGATYTTGNFLLRTPASGNSFTFVGESVTVNNTNGINGGLLYKGAGATGVVRFKNLNLNGGYVRHASSSNDLFQLAGNVTLAGNATIDAAQGPITIHAGMGGSGSLTKIGSFPVTLTGASNYTGMTTIHAGTLRLAPAAPIASYTFDDISGSTVNNGGTGGATMNGTLTGGAAIVPGGRFGNAVSVAGGASVDINNPITNLGNTASWTVSAWVKTSTPGSTILSKSNGGWASGNTVFYLGDGTAGGNGGIPSSVRWGGGFYQGAAGTTSVTNDAWRLVTYVHDAGINSIYVDGALQSLSSGNSGFSNADVGSIVRLGTTTNTFAGDGTVNFNGLLDSVQFYNQALSPTQVSSLFQGTSAGPLPTTTNVTIASGATLDLNGTNQTIRSLSGPAGGSVTLGAGRLTIDATSYQPHFSGTISGTGSLVKSGDGTVELRGANTYSGGTTVTSGRLEFISNTGGSATGSGPVYVGDAATFSGGGVITTDNADVVIDGGELSPESFWRGTLTFSLGSGTLDISAADDGDLNFDLSVTSASDRVVLTSGTLNIGTLDFDDFDFSFPNLHRGPGTLILFDSATDIVGSIGQAEGYFNADTFKGMLRIDEELDDVVLDVTIPGDFNLDSYVDAADYVMWRKLYDSNPALYQEWFQCFNRSNAPLRLQAGDTPEPSALGLAMFGAALLSLSLRVGATGTASAFPRSR
jgi:autotransporter-associated beta strand protein